MKMMISMLAIKSGNLLSFIREELEDRKKLGYPPFKRFIKITYLGDKEETQKQEKFWQKFYKNILRKFLALLSPRQKENNIDKCFNKNRSKKMVFARNFR